MCAGWVELTKYYLYSSAMNCIGKKDWQAFKHYKKY